MHEESLHWQPSIAMHEPGKWEFHRDTYNIQPTKPFSSALYHSFNVALDGHICRDQMGPLANLVDVVSDSAQLITFGRDVVQSNVESISGKTKSDATPDTLGRSSDQCYPFDDGHELKNGWKAERPVHLREQVPKGDKTGENI